MDRVFVYLFLSIRVSLANGAERDGRFYIFS